MAGWQDKLDSLPGLTREQRDQVEEYITSRYTTLDERTGALRGTPYEAKARMLEGIAGMAPAWVKRVKTLCCLKNGLTEPQFSIAVSRMSDWPAERRNAILSLREQEAVRALLALVEQSPVQPWRSWRWWGEAVLDSWFVLGRAFATLIPTLGTYILWIWLRDMPGKEAICFLVWLGLALSLPSQFGDEAATKAKAQIMASMSSFAVLWSERPWA
eukprot:CAMPEP_0119111230 /NCGR_PEP_ID=MMETSP1180-20130426/34673_1 /TAXON_ID=3052 ORGANISM="Chlamydomonas cf sp, Strain CCMP681" /NCGR_SAMPLE_ID=MMETSP1180 /ASSEMBLY_ACC=CAM_ASM_000741 /LENGTH=214 /DNA_ID=CAMNT_0007098083 /DNA_START=81 /DNA_END=725 /DNA_ORIENTATION=-